MDQHRVQIRIDMEFLLILDQDFFEEHIELHLGWDNICCIHLNDSQRELNCHLDRHEDFFGSKLIVFFVTL